MAGCASTNVNQQTPMTAPGLARPNQIWVYDFVAASSDMPADSSLAGQVGAPSTPPTPEEIETGGKYGAMITQKLVIDIQGMGMTAIERVRDHRRRSATAQSVDTSFQQKVAVWEAWSSAAGST